MNKKTIRIIVESAITVVLFILFCFWKSVFSGELDKVDLFKTLCDGLFILAALFLSVAIVKYTASQGEFDSFKYGVKHWFRARKPQKNYTLDEQNMGDYILEKNKDRKAEVTPELIIGGALLVLCIIFYIIYKFI